MKKLLLTLTTAVASLGGLATSAQAHPGYGHHCGYHYGYWYWRNGCRFWQVVVAPAPFPPCP